MSKRRSNSWSPSSSRSNRASTSAAERPDPGADAARFRYGSVQKHLVGLTQLSPAIRSSICESSHTTGPIWDRFAIQRFGIPDRSNQRELHGEMNHHLGIPNVRRIAVLAFALIMAFALTASLVGSQAEAGKKKKAKPAKVTLDGRHEKPAAASESEEAGDQGQVDWQGFSEALRGECQQEQLLQDEDGQVQEEGHQRPFLSP